MASATAPELKRARSFATSSPGAHCPWPSQQDGVDKRGPISDYEGQEEESVGHDVQEEKMNAELQ